MQVIDYQAPAGAATPRSVGWAIGCFYAGSALSATLGTLGTLVALVAMPTPEMADAPPVMVVCPMPFATGVLALLTCAFAAALRWIMGGRFVSRGTAVAIGAGVLVGSLFVAGMYVPVASEAAAGFLSLFIIPFGSALLITRRLSAV